MSPERLSPAAFARHRETRPDAALLDVRTPDEFAAGHLVGAENVDVLADTFLDRVGALDPARTYYVYCRSGQRSGRAAELMRTAGFDDVHNVGGFEELAGAGFDAHRP